VKNNQADELQTRFNVKKGGYVTLDTLITLYPGTNNINFQLKPLPSFIIKGIIWNQTGDYHPPNTTLYLQADNDTIRSITIGDDGSFNITYQGIPGTTNIKIWAVADSFTNGTITVLDPEKIAVRGIITSAEPFWGPDTATTEVQKIALSQGIVIELLHDKWFYSNLWRRTTGGREGGTRKRGGPYKIEVLETDIETGEYISQGLLGMYETVAAGRVAEETQANGIILNTAEYYVNDTASGVTENIQYIFRMSGTPGNTSPPIMDENGYITYHTAHTPEGVTIGTVAEEVYEEYLNENEYGSMGGIVGSDGYLTPLGRAAYHFIQTHPKGIETPLIYEYVGQAAEKINELRAKAAKEQRRNESQGIKLKEK